MGFKVPKEVFLDTEYSKEFDMFLLQDVGYDKLSEIAKGIFISPYAATSLREYIATAYKLEVGHPPGAPFFQLFGRIFSLFAAQGTSEVALILSVSLFFRVSNPVNFVIIFFANRVPME